MRWLGGRGGVPGLLKDAKSFLIQDDCPADPRPDQTRLGSKIFHQKDYDLLNAEKIVTIFSSKAILN